MASPHVAVVLSGCGHQDGAEVRESVFTLLCLDQAGASFQCFAPDKPQADVVDHVTGEVMDGETRNVLKEAARIARGDIIPLSDYDAAAFDALVFPGGFGGAKNLSDFATNGAHATVDPDVRAAVESTKAAGKPIGFICITPASVGALVLGNDDITLTVGADDDAAAEGLRAAGADHVACPVTESLVDKKNKVVSTPAYMDGGASPAQVFEGIRHLVDDVLSLTEEPSVEVTDDPSVIGRSSMP